jgi:nitrous oxidase accessory protein
MFKRWGDGRDIIEFSCSFQRCRRLIGAALLCGLLCGSALRISQGRPIYAAQPTTFPASTLQARLDQAKEGEIIELPKGRWIGSLRIKKRLTLRGKGSILDGGGRGKVVILEAAGTILEGLQIQGSGTDLGGPDSCVFVTKSASGSILRGNTLRDCAFGIWTHEANDIKVLNNRVFGRAETREADRGNGIHLFDGSRLLIQGNHIRDARDGIYISAVKDSVILENHLSHQRYGVHYMYSHRNRLIRNHSVKNLTGLALMQSHHLWVEGNTAEHNERHGILFRDAQYCTIRDNLLVENGEGMFFFSSNDNVIEGNRIRHNRIGARIWAGTYRNRVQKNAFLHNTQQIFFVGATDLHWGQGEDIGNYWTDYLGWDQDKDGIGDRPYRLDSFTSRLLYQYPSSVLLLRSPSLELLGHMEQKLPLLRVATVMDHRPLMRWGGK